jgi:hypothetical protein
MKNPAIFAATFAATVIAINEFVLVPFLKKKVDDDMERIRRKLLKAYLEDVSCLPPKTAEKLMHHQLGWSYVRDSSEASYKLCHTDGQTKDKKGLESSGLRIEVCPEGGPFEREFVGPFPARVDPETYRNEEWIDYQTKWLKGEPCSLPSPRLRE